MTSTPVFVVGLPRSGSTLVEQIISGHTDVQGLGELLSFRRHSRSKLKPGGRREKNCGSCGSVILIALLAHTGPADTLRTSYPTTFDSCQSWHQLSLRLSLCIFIEIPRQIAGQILKHFFQKNQRVSRIATI